MSYGKVDWTRKLPGPWTTTWNKQYLSAVHPLTCSLLWVRYLFDPLKVWGFGSKWPMSGNFSYISVQNLRFNHDSHPTAKFGENWPLRSRLKVFSYCLQKKFRHHGHFWAPISPPLSWSRSKFCERCRPLTCVCVPILVRIGCGLPDLFLKESKKVKTI